MPKQVKIKAVRKRGEALDYDAISYVLFVAAKRRVEERRKHKEQDRIARRKGRS